MSPRSPPKPQGGMVIISYAAYPSGSVAAASPGDCLPLSNATPVPSGQVTKIEQDQTLLENFVHNPAGSSEIATPSVIGTEGAVINTVSTITSAESFSNVMALLNRFVQIGDAIAEVRRSTCPAAKGHLANLIRWQVHPYAKLAWSVLTAAQKVCIINYVVTKSYVYTNRSSKASKIRMIKCEDSGQLSSTLWTSCGRQSLSRKSKGSRKRCKRR